MSGDDDEDNDFLYMHYDKIDFSRMHMVFRHLSLFNNVWLMSGFRVMRLVSPNRSKFPQMDTDRMHVERIGCCGCTQSSIYPCSSVENLTPRYIEDAVN
jgi:hypothetical protein